MRKIEFKLDVIKLLKSEFRSNDIILITGLSVCCKVTLYIDLTTLNLIVSIESCKTTVLCIVVGTSSRIL